MSKYSIPIRPVSINSYYRTTRQGRIYVCKKGKDFKDSMYQYITEKYPKALCLNCPISLSIKLNFKDRRRLDADNYLKPLIDSLNKVLWRDDHLIYELHVYKSALNIKNSVELEIEELKHIKVPEVHRPNQKQYQKPFHCECGTTLTSKKNLDIHLKSKKHIRIMSESIETKNEDLDDLCLDDLEIME